MTESWKDRVLREQAEQGDTRRNASGNREVEYRAHIKNISELLGRYSRQLGIEELVAEVHRNWGDGVVASPIMKDELSHRYPPEQDFHKENLSGNLTLSAELKFDCTEILYWNIPALPTRMGSIAHTTPDGGVWTSKGLIPASPASTQAKFIDGKAIFNAGVRYSAIPSSDYKTQWHEEYEAFVADNVGGESSYLLQWTERFKVPPPITPVHRTVEEVRELLKKKAYEKFKKRTTENELPQDIKRKVRTRTNAMLKDGWSTTRSI